MQDKVSLIWKKDWHSQIETHAQPSQKMLGPIGIIRIEAPQAPNHKLNSAKQVLPEKTANWDYECQEGIALFTHKQPHRNLSVFQQDCLLRSLIFSLPSFEKKSMCLFATRVIRRRSGNNHMAVRT